MLSTAKSLHLPAKYILVKQGEDADSIYFVLQGLCHACYLTEQGKQFSKEFYWEQDWIIGFEGLIGSLPSAYLVETLTETKLLCLPVSSIEQWREQSHPVYIKLLEKQLLHKENKERFMLLHTPAQRYALFCRHYPHLQERLSDYQIAAYLGITHISLSRIKARLKENS
ncbi:Crp/Fnr family transcriptional regulator [Psychromonas ossibalaenae]|uniref:Crp/Fnr family transcriptional regulator n=1 Tax=Psychromonas ossibalaenae TaxID=444922 RepID=UPI002480A7D3|nr:Crp/Fnr family transcriptional regulator [Psychromonas ossibalaenae]